MSVAIGIDLGTTNTVVGAVVDGVAVTIEDEHRRRLIPSIVSFHPSGNVLVGDLAKERRLLDPENTIFSVKRLIGRPWSSEEVQNARARFPFKLVEGPKNTTMVIARDVSYALPEISAFVLRRAKAIAEAALGETVDRAVITVPANFNDLQRASTKVAGKLAGLDVLRILNEPTAAALAYGQSIAQAERIAVYDLGGGTFDITLLDLSGSVFEVLSTAGDTSLGGDDIDTLVADRIAEQIVRQHRFDPRTNPVALGRLRMIGETMKQQLSTLADVAIEVRDVGWGEGGVPLSVTAKMTRDELEKLSMPLIDRTFDVSNRSIEAVNLTPRSFDRVILVGGSTRMPLVSRKAQEFFGQAPHLRVNPDEVVALGAAIQAYSLSRAKGGGRRRTATSSLAANQAATESSVASQPPRAQTMSEAAPPMPPMAKERTLPLGSVNAPLDRTMPMAARSPQAPLAAKPPPVPARSSRPDTGAPPQGASAPPPPMMMELRKSHATISFTPVPPRFEDPRAEPMPSLPARPSRPSKPGSDPPPAEPTLPLDSIPASDSGTLPPLKDRVSISRIMAATQLETRREAPLLIDVTPLSLRVETVGGYSDTLIDANTPVPCDRTRVFLTATDNQTSVYIRVAQGESPHFRENAYLGELELSGLKSAPRGDVQIAVTFELDADGILNVRAQDKETGRATNATMRLLGANTDEADVAQMMARQAKHQVL